MFTVELVREASFGEGDVPRLTLPPGQYTAKTTVERSSGAPAIAIPIDGGATELLVPLRLAWRFFKGWGRMAGASPAIPGI